MCLSYSVFSHQILSRSHILLFVNAWFLYSLCSDDDFSNLRREASFSCDPASVINDSVIRCKQCCVMGVYFIFLLGNKKIKTRTH